MPASSGRLGRILQRIGRYTSPFSFLFPLLCRMKPPLARSPSLSGLCTLGYLARRRQAKRGLGARRETLCPSGCPEGVAPLPQVGWKESRSARRGVGCRSQDRHRPHSGSNTKYLRAHCCRYSRIIDATHRPRWLAVCLAGHHSYRAFVVFSVSALVCVEVADRASMSRMGALRSYGPVFAAVVLSSIHEAARSERSCVAPGGGQPGGRPGGHRVYPGVAGGRSWPGANQLRRVAGEMGRCRSKFRRARPTLVQLWRILRHQIWPAFDRSRTWPARRRPSLAQARSDLVDSGPNLAEAGPHRSFSL